MDIFDTSAVRSLGRNALSQIAASRQAAVSPVTVYELLCHLDETKDQRYVGDKAVFDNRKAELLKLKEIQILHDPHAAHAIAIGATAITNQSRFKDAKLVSLLIGKLEFATTLQDFYNQTITDASGQQYTVADCAAKARRELDVEENRFKGAFIDVGNNCLKKLRMLRTQDFTDQELFEEINGMCDKLVHIYKNDGVVSPNLAKDVINSIYIHYGYIAARTLSYLGKPGMKYDVNDMEDGVICLHVELNRDDILVTNDGGTCKAVERAIRAFNQCAGGQSSALCRVMIAMDYCREIGLP